MTASPAEQRRQRQRTDARRAILDASEALLVEDGYERFSMRRLADRCGYTAPTIYHYFGDKPGLLDALLEERFERMLLDLRSVRPGGDPAGYLRDMARAFVGFALRNPNHYRVLMAPRPDGSEPPRAAEEARELLQQPLHELKAAGRLRIDDFEAVAQSLWALTHGLISLHILRPDHEWSVDLLDVSLEIFLNGLLRGSSARDESRPT